MRETRSTCCYCGVGCGVIIKSEGAQIIGGTANNSNCGGVYPGGAITVFAQSAVGVLEAIVRGRDLEDAVGAEPEMPVAEEPHPLGCQPDAEPGGIHHHVVVPEPVGLHEVSFEHRSPPL